MGNKDRPPLIINPYPEDLVNVDLARGMNSFVVSIQNTTKSSYMYKMKLSNFELFHANPYQGILESNSSLNITITLKKTAKELNFLDTKSTHTRLLFEYGPYKSKMGDFSTAWKTAHGSTPTAPPTPTSSPQSTPPPPYGFFFHKFMAKVSPPAHVPANYAQFMEQKVDLQDTKLEKISWLLAEKTTECRELRDELQFYKDLVSKMQEDARKVHYIVETCSACAAVLHTLPKMMNYHDTSNFDYQKWKNKNQCTHGTENNDNVITTRNDDEDSTIRIPSHISRKSISTYSDQHDNRLGRYGSNGSDDGTINVSTTRSSLLSPFQRRERKSNNIPRAVIDTDADGNNEITTVTTTITTPTSKKKQ